LTSDNLVLNERFVRGQTPGIISQTPPAGTVVSRRSVVDITAVATPLHRRQTNPIHVVAQLPASACSSAKGPGVRVISAFEITSAELRLPPLSDRGSLSRQAPDSRWLMCYVAGPDAWVSYGPVASHANRAVWIYYRNGSLAEVYATLASSYRFKVATGVSGNGTVTGEFVWSLPLMPYHFPGGTVTFVPQSGHGPSTTAVIWKSGWFTKSLSPGRWMLIGTVRGQRTPHVYSCARTDVTVRDGARVTVHFGCAFP
jgi:hypothetical protein